MTTLTNSFEGGTSGVTVSAANSGGASGNAFDFAVAGSGGTLIYDSTVAAHGLLSAKLASTTANVTDFEWAASFGSGNATAWWRGYFYFTANPGANIRLWNATTGTSNYAAFLSGSGKLIVTYGSGGTTFVTFTDAVPLNQWFRVEGFVTISASAGQVAASLYDSMDSAAPTETHTSAANLNTGTPGSTTCAWGDSNGTASNGPYWIDDVGLSSAGPLGPWTPAGGGGSNIVAVLVASM